MSTKLKEYSAGRDDGLLKAYELVMKEGVPALKKELDFRRITGIHTTYANKELDEASHKLKMVCMETIRIASVSVLHDRFGFGEQRCNRFIKEYDKIAIYLKNGWIYWTDLIQGIKNSMNIEMQQEFLSKADMAGTYIHPEPQDIYSEKDLIDHDEWNNLLKELKFRERKNGNTMEVLDHNGEVILTYTDLWEQIQVCDVLTGILIAKERWGFKE